MSGLEINVESFQQSLAQAGEDVRRACATAVAQYATAAAAAIQGEYPVGPTGTLKARVYARSGTARGGYTTDHSATWTVFSRAPHSWIYNHGTGERYDSTRNNARRGRMPGNHVIGRVMSDARRGLEHEAQRILDQDRQV